MNPKAVTDLIFLVLATFAYFFAFQKIYNCYIMKEPKQVNYFDYYPKNIPQCEESWGNEELKIISELNNIVNGGVEGNYCFIHQTQI